MYHITLNTQAIMHETKGSFKTKIIEENKVLYSKYSPMEIIKENCDIHGSSLQGRLDTVKKILRSKSKLPISISPFSGIYFFPTTSMRNNDCIWLSYYQILRLGEMKDQPYICFRDKSILRVETSLNQLDQQFKRTSQVIAQFHFIILQMLNRF